MESRAVSTHHHLLERDGLPSTHPEATCAHVCVKPPTPGAAPVIRPFHPVRRWLRRISNLVARPRQPSVIRASRSQPHQPARCRQRISRSPIRTDDAGWQAHPSAQEGSSPPSATAMLDVSAMPLTASTHTALSFSSSVSGHSPESSQPSTPSFYHGNATEDASSIQPGSMHGPAHHPSGHHALGHFHRLRHHPRQRKPVQWIQRRLQSLGRGLRSLASFLGQQIHPKGPGHNDTTWHERIMNVVTCAPFMWVGTTVLRSCKAAASRHFGHSFLVVGVVAGLYHGASGPSRLLLRKLDYWCIAYSSGALRHAMFGHAPAWATVVSAAIIPVKPTLVSGTNFILVELQCAAAALKSGPGLLLLHWLGHAVAGVVAMTCFTLEDNPELAKRFPFLHSAWHCLSAVSIISTTPFVLAAERCLVT